MEKQVIVVCKKCKEETNITIHWLNSVFYNTCKNCKCENKYEFKNGNLK